MVVTATRAAVSVRRRLSPRVTGVKPDEMAEATSSCEKSPSGPMRMAVLSPDLAVRANNLRSNSSEQ